ncbi:MAG: hypothetical protein ACOYN8_02015 [Pseudanabaena sp.]
MPSLHKFSVSRLLVILLLCFSFYFATYIGSGSNLATTAIFAQSNPETTNNTASSAPNVSAANSTDAAKPPVSKDNATEAAKPSAIKDNNTDAANPVNKHNAKDSVKKTTSPDSNPLGMNNLIPFPSNVALPIKVGVALFVNNISKINEAANTFESQFDLRYDWKDPRLAFDTGEMGTNRLEFGQEAAIAKLATIWNPQIKITNIIEKDAQIVPGLFIHYDGEVELIQRVKATFESKLNLDAFPFDSQSLLVAMLSSKYNSNQIALTQDQEDLNESGLDPDLKVNGWKPQGISFKMTQLRAWNGAFLRQIEARVSMRRIPNAILGSIFTPFLLTLIVPTIFTFFANVELAPRLVAWSGSILALVALTFTFSVRYPWLGSNSLVSQIFTAGHAYQLVSVLLSITLFNPDVAKKMDRFIVAELVSYLRWLVPVGFLGVLITKSLLTAFDW